MAREHSYAVTVTWTGNLGQGTATYRGYARDHAISVPGKPPIAGSSDPAFRGDPARYNPEDLLVASASACHMLWYLHLCAVAKVIVIEYVDDAVGTMEETADGSGRFTRVVLRPRVVIARDSAGATAERLHGKAHEMCFIANSVNFPIAIEPRIEVAAEA
jgi:organic hydroperoxide reductase OsmC/OhrA